MCVCVCVCVYVCVHVNVVHRKAIDTPQAHPVHQYILRAGHPFRAAPALDLYMHAATMHQNIDIVRE